MLKHPTLDLLHQLGLAGMAQGNDDALYLSDDANGVIYRISYESDSAAKRPTPAFTNADAGSLNIGLVSQRDSNDDESDSQAGGS